MISLRPHQEKAIEMLRASIRAGNRRVILAAPCSFGKTRTAAYMLAKAAEKGVRSAFVCDRIKLVEQALDDFDDHGLDVGVIQGDHYRWNPKAPIQICSVQTLARKRDMLPVNLVIVDEAHTHYEYVTKMMAKYNAVVFVGLTATPYAKGLGQHWDDMVVPATTEDLLDQGYLTPVRYYAGATVDLKGVKSRSLPTGGSDFDPKSVAAKYEDSVEVTGDIVKNWIKYGENSQTIAFAPSIKHSKFLVSQFREAGISAEHIDGYMDQEQRQWIYEAHDRGEFKILSCSRLLNTGYDAPRVRCLIDAFPTRSYITHVQRVGRILRLWDGEYEDGTKKEYSIVLDHAGNTERLGMVEYIVPSELDDGEKAFSEKNQIEEKKESKVRECPQCYQMFTGIKCVCGYEVPMTSRIEHDGTMLEELKTKRKENVMVSKQDKAQFLGELFAYARAKGYKQGWAQHKYRERFGVWGSKIKAAETSTVSQDTLNWITHINIKNAKRKAS
jgi:DNA repair protein RadD